MRTRTDCGAQLVNRQRPEGGGEGGLDSLPFPHSSQVWIAAGLTYPSLPSGGSQRQESLPTECPLKPKV